MDIQPIIVTLIKESLVIINSKYSDLAYHNTGHTLRVVEAVTNIASVALLNNKITEREALLLPLAAAFHDVEHGNSKNNELISSELAKEYMLKYSEFNQRDIRVVQDAIMATTVNDTTKLTQDVDDSKYYTLILADADLADFGRTYEEYSYSFNQYFKEIHPKASIDSAIFASFLEQQTDILKYHIYHTPEAENIFINQKDNLNKINQLLASIKVQ